MATIIRRHRIPDAIKVPVLLRFTTGKIVDPSRCPKGISAGDEVNTVCLCADARVSV